MRKPLLFFLLTLLAVVIFPGAALAEVDFRYQFNYSGSFHADRWNVLAVTVQNQLDEDWLGTLEVVFESTYAEEVFVAGGRETTVLFNLPPYGFHTSFISASNYQPPPANQLQINLKDSNDRVVESQRVVPYIKDLTYIGVFTSQPEHFNRLANLVDGAIIVPMQSRYLDHEQHLDLLSVIVVSDMETLLLKPEQVGNLAAWLEKGGLLVVGGGRGWQKNIAALPAELLPFQPDGTLESGNLHITGAEISFSGTAPAYLFSSGTVQGKVQLAAAETPLLISKGYGRGSVVYSTLNLEDPPFNNAQNYETFWNYILFSNMEQLGERAATTLNWYFFEMIRYLVSGNIELGFLSPLNAFLGLLLYILLVGPVSYFVLRRWQRWEWGWFVIPALALLFTAATYTIATLSRSSELTNYQVNVVEMIHGNKASVQSYNTLFIPRRGALTFEFPFSSLAAGEGVTATRGSAPGETLVEVANPPLWSVQRVFGKSTVELAGPLQLEVNLGLNPPEGLITNNTGLDLFESFLRVGSTWVNTGELKAGEQKSVTLKSGGSVDLSGVLQRYGAGRTGLGSMGARSPVHLPHFGLDEMFITQSSVALIGFNEDAGLVGLANVNSVPFNIIIAAVETSELNLPPAFDLPEGWLVPRLIVSSDAILRDPYRHYDQQSYFTGRGRIDLVYTFPPGIDYSQGSYKLNFRDFHGYGQTELMAYNHGSSGWVKLADIPSNAPFEYVLTEIAELVREDRLLLRINYDGEMWLMPNRLLSVKGGQMR